MTSLIVRFGALGVFALMVPESACIPLPSEVTLLFSGLAVHEGWMSFQLAALAATGGNLLGSLLAYGLGATGLLQRLPIARAVLDRWDHLLGRYGIRAVLIARLLPLARTFVSLPAGARRVPLIPFIVLTTIGCALWAIAFILGGMITAGAWAAVDTVVGRALLGVGLLIVAGSVIRRRKPH